jgi:hypothetical protein
MDFTVLAGTSVGLFLDPVIAAVALAIVLVSKDAPWPMRLLSATCIAAFAEIVGAAFMHPATTNEVFVGAAMVAAFVWSVIFVAIAQIRKTRTV